MLLGFSPIFYGCPKYGMVADQFEIRGTVTNTQQQPIKNIRIVRERNYGRGDTVYTNAEGRYIINPFNLSRIECLKVEDIDGEENGGEFLSQELMVQFTDKDIVEKARGNKRGNKFVKIQNIRLYRVDEEIPIAYGPLAAPYKP
jgi:putative lipoprotein (rSAM/lipoprotein system)